MPSGLYHTTYRSSIKRFQTFFVKFWFTLFVMGLIALPLLGFNYILSILINAGIAVIVVLGLNVLTGMTGLISIGHAAFVGIGAYASVILTTRLGMPYYLVFFCAGAIAALSGLIVGIPSLRLKGLYLAITTMGFQFIAQHVFLRWTSLTAGTAGLEVPPIRFGHWAFNTDVKMYYFVLLVVALAITGVSNLTRSRVGRAFVAIRDSYIAAEVMGVSLFRYKLLAFSLSAFYAGVAGSLLAHYSGFISPEGFYMELSIQYIAMIIVGGMGTVLGSIYGATFMTIIPEILRYITSKLGEDYPYFVSIFVYSKGLIFGLFILLFLIFEPDGFYGRWRKIKTYFRIWPYSY